LVGIADVVEFHPTSSREGVVLSGLAGSWLPYPVEYKRGRRKKDSCDKIQLCSQALCLEEMLNVDIPEGALFYGKSRRRLIVSIDKKLRNLTLDFIKKFRNLLAEGVTPKGDYGPKCDSCSLKEICLPLIKKSSSSLSRYLNSFFEEEDC
jgi:CRISPR-associated exonuclease Cas4